MTARVLFAVVLVTLSVLFLWQFGPVSSSRVPHFDKLVHFGAFFVLAFTFHRAFPIPLWAGILVLTLYGVAIEIAQSLTPYRSAEIMDLVADAAGVVSYYLVHWVYQTWRQRRQLQKRR